ncbi:MAG: TetR/AcrR family transcriptional regulator [Rhodospirillales bacterium]|nr:TetR/AcrR family transcriptional regulator [Rhodospirillales bacterium]
MRARLIGATIESLVEHGYARTTAVEVCRRAGVTRGAFHHHFDSLASLLAAALSETYDEHFVPRREQRPKTIADWIDAAWAHLQRPQFKAVIEIWLAARNEPELAAGLQPAIGKYKKIFSIEENEILRRQFGESARIRAFYRLCAETMIGLALGRATTPGGAPLDHEANVIDQLRELATVVK